MTSIAGMSDKIVLNFAWTGPNTWNGGSSSRGGSDIGIVDLVFKDAKKEISVLLPDNINPTGAQKFSFTCRKYLGKEDGDFPIAKETHPDSLCVTIEQVHNLTVRAGYFEKGRPIGPKIMDTRTGKITQQHTVRRTDMNARLEIPEELEIGQKYSLVVSSNGHSLSARLIKEEKTARPTENKQAASGDEVQRRMRKMGEALIAEGMQNLGLALSGERGTFDSSSTAADVVVHGLKGVIRAGQEMHPEIKVPHTRPSESPADLDKLSADELQSRFEATFRKDKMFERQRMQAAFTGNLPEMNRILPLEMENTRLLINLNEALERKGVKALIPQIAGF